MSSEEKGKFATDIPDQAIADAVAAVEKHAHETGRASTTAADDAACAQHERGQDERGDAAQDERVDVDELQAQLREEHDLRLRALADLDNFRKRVAREREELRKMGAEGLMRDLLPVLDNLDRAMAALPEGPLALGVAMTQRHLEETLKRHGLKAFTVEPGTVFDPRVHEAITTTPSSEQPAGAVVDQELRGYFLHDRLLRPASVVVASAPSVNDHE
jgi:molecular chaperone GrpE